MAYQEPGGSPLVHPNAREEEREPELAQESRILVHTIGNLSHFMPKRAMLGCYGSVSILQN